MISFDSILGNNQAQLAIILTLLQPSSCSLLISGESGTGKTSLLRSLYSVLGDERHDLIVNIPSSTTQEMLSDYMDTDLLIKHGSIKYKSGLLNRLNGKIVLIDNINLHDRMVLQSILDYQATCAIKNSFKIIATINPNEGGLSSTILDQFNLFVELRTVRDIEVRRQILRKSIDKVSRIPKENPLYATIKQSQLMTNKVHLEEELMALIAKTCQDYFVLGHRGDIALLNAAIAHAAWMGKSRVEKGDVKAVQDLALLHRRLNPAHEPPETSTDDNNDESHEQQEDGRDNKSSNDGQQTEETQPKDNQKLSLTPYAGQSSDRDATHGDDSPDNKPNFDDSARTQEHQELPIDFYLEYDPLDHLGRSTRLDAGFGSRVKSTQNNFRGSFRKAVPERGNIEHLAFSATIRTAAPFQRHRRQSAPLNAPRVLLQPMDYRFQVKQHRTGYHILFVVDASGSMGVKRRMKKVKGLIIELLKNSYVKRDRVGMLAFRGESCELILPFTKSVSKAQELLKEVRTGGRTPLYLGMRKATEVVQALKRREQKAAPVIVLLTDGRATSSYKSENTESELSAIGQQLKAHSVKTIIIDTEEGFLRLGLAKKLANNIDAQYYTLDQLDSDTILSV
ncbi:VWA domain-containing protein [Porphyromonadaceae bacterium W3.11]|nr:VWA domain-containing protein [Porphyromonadaceae bacterium W3.11]